MRAVPYVKVTRSGIVESVHCIAACAIGPDGSEVLAIGDVDVPVYLRSSAKPFIASCVIDAGAHERFAFEPKEIAVIAASHAGEDFHIRAVRSILRKIGLSEDDLQCGPEGDGHPAQPIYNNCSGKHAGILALCKVMDADHRTYLQPDNPAQRRILDVCARMSNESASAWHIGVDGCGIPVYATSLRNAATSYMRLATGRGLSENHSRALRIVRDAMMAYPEYVSGTSDFDAALMRAGSGAIACKGGAEGVHGSALLPQEMGVVLKVADGSSRARPAAALHALRSLGVLSDEQLAALQVFASAPVRTKAGRLVGEIRGV